MLVTTIHVELENIPRNYSNITISFQKGTQNNPEPYIDVMLFFNKTEHLAR